MKAEASGILPKKSAWEKVKPNLYPTLLNDPEVRSLKWHSHSASPRSSPTFCINAFGGLRTLSVKDAVLERLFGTAFGAGMEAPQRKWQITPELSVPELLGEFGGQPTAIDTLCTT